MHMYAQFDQNISCGSRVFSLTDHEYFHLLTHIAIIMHSKGRAILNQHNNYANR